MEQDTGVSHRVLGAAQVGPGDRVVVLGTSADMGMLTRTALTLGGSPEVVAVLGLDPVLRRLRLAPGVGSLRGIVADPGRLPLRDGSVTAVVGHGVAGVAGLPAVLADADRDLVPGGRFALAEPLHHARRYDDVLPGLTAHDAVREPLGASLAGRYETACHQLLDDRGTVTITTLMVYLSARRARAGRR